MCGTDDSTNSADEFFEALSRVRKQVEAAFAEITAAQRDRRFESEKDNRITGLGGGHDLVSGYLELAAPEERKE